MARDLCVEFADAYYHVFSRGLNRQAIFNDSEDCSFFTKLLSIATRRYSIKIHGFCLMSNHYHLFLCTPQANLSKTMQFINGTYAMYFLDKYPEKDGHVFKGRYKRRIVEVERYTLNLVRYIHFNPVKAGLVGHPGDWAWSSYNSFIDHQIKDFQFLHLEWVLNQFGDQQQGEARNFKNFHMLNLEDSWEPNHDSKAGVFLGDQNFVADIVNSHVDLKELDLENINGFSDLKQKFEISSDQIIQSVKDLNIDEKLRYQSTVYLLHEFAGLKIEDIARLFDQTKNTVSKAKQRFKKKLKTEKKLLSIIQKVADGRIRP